jgi:predicted phage terminase large subunit-like protein
LVGKKGTQIHILKVFNRQTSISALITWLYDTYESIPEKARPLVRWYSEASFLQGDLIGAEVQEEGEKRGYELPLRQDKRQKPNKEARIESLSPLFEKGKIVWDTKIKDDSDTKTAIEHLLCFERGTRTPDDFPDALEGAIFLLHQKVIAERGNDNTRLGLRESDFLY